MVRCSSFIDVVCERCGHAHSSKLVSAKVRAKSNQGINADFKARNKYPKKLEPGGTNLKNSNIYYLHDNHPYIWKKLPFLYPQVKSPKIYIGLINKNFPLTCFEYII